jgi:ferric-dicitrate binding protein FerR (iron transport regulator)
MSQEVLDQATDWVIRRDGLERALSRWLETSPAHQNAFERVSDMWKRLGRIDPRRTIDVVALIEKVRADEPPRKR